MTGVADVGAPTFQILVVEDAEQPSPNLGTALEAVQATEEGGEDVLDQIFRFGFRHPQAARGTIQRASVFGYYDGKDLRVAAAEPVQQILGKHYMVHQLPRGYFI